jgi:single stranded DNA-binding protein
MLNKVLLIGYAGADSEMKFTPAGIPVANFSLAVKEVDKSGDGERKTNTLWIRRAAWRRWAEIAGEFVTKGKFRSIEGRLQLRTRGPRREEARCDGSGCHAAAVIGAGQKRERCKAGRVLEGC